MSKEHYNTVRESDLYEYGGYRKSLLMQIAGLIIGPPEEDAQGKPITEPDEDEGWCVARQEILAAWVSCSREQAVRMIGEFVADGWLTVDKHYDSFGHERNRYTITPDQLKKIQARKMKIEQVNGIKHPVRASKPKKARGEKSRANLVKIASGKRSHHKKLEPPCDNLSQSPVTESHKAPGQLVTKPVDTVSQPVVTPVLPSLGRNNGHSLDAKEKPGGLSSLLEGKKENPKTPYALSGGNHAEGTAPRRVPRADLARESARQEARINARQMVGDLAVDSPVLPAVRPKALVELKPEVVAKLRAFGCPDSCLDLIQRHTMIATILNGETPGGCSNPVTAYATIAGRNPKFARLWMPNLSPQKEILGSSEQEVEDMVAMKKHLDSMPLEERDYRAAQYWQMGFTLEQKKALGLFATAPGHDGDTCKNELGICKACDAVHRKNLVEAYTVAMSTGKGSAAQAWRREHGIPESDNAVVVGAQP